ncbi:MAG: hypothetical protein AAF213_01680 [Pseudomonadota bacterium]
MALFGKQTVRKDRPSFGRLNKTEQAERYRDAALFEAVGVAGLSIDLKDETRRLVSKPSVQAAAKQFGARIDAVFREQGRAPLSRNGRDLLTRTNDWMKRVADSDEPGPIMMAFRRDVRGHAQAVAEEIMHGNEVAPPVDLPSDAHKQALDQAHFTLRKLH